MIKIKDLIKEFIDIEYRCQQSKWNIKISDEMVVNLNEELKNYCHSFFSYSSFERTGFEFDDEDDIILATKKMNKYTPRTLFQIKQYKDFELGDALKRIVTGKELYACYVSYPSKGSRELYFSSIFYVAETNEGMRIIYQKSFDSDAGKWYHPVDMDVTTVISEGNLVAVEKYQPPVEETSLADYNRE